MNNKEKNDYIYFNTEIQNENISLSFINEKEEEQLLNNNLTVMFQNLMGGKKLNTKYFRSSK